MDEDNEYHKQSSIFAAATADGQAETTINDQTGNNQKQ
jgi:hypothetical protein